ncbi:MAG: SIMPL domain-containing protein [Pseudomonadota bacterium]|nr:SIMPL domain-containing protein [Pseudomonadota bacterium]
MQKDFGRFYLGIFLSLGIIIAGYFMSNTLYKAKVGANVAEVKGLAERQITADTANWSIGFGVSDRVSNQDVVELQKLYKNAGEHQTKIVNLLKEKGFEESEISTDAFDYFIREYRNEDNVLVDTKNLLSGKVVVQTNKVHKVKEVRSNINELIAAGVKIDNQLPIYRFTKLNEIKPDMLKEATENARIAANEFAQNADATVGRIKNARQGGFYIRDVGKDYSDTEKIEKIARVVTTISFYLVD